MEAVRIAALVVVGIGAATDLKSRRLPNALTFGGAAVALAYRTWAGGVAGLAGGAEGWAVGVGLFLPVFLVGGMGAGDVKLLGAVGAWLGPMGALWSALYTAFAGGALALIVGARYGYLGTAFKNLWILLGSWRATGVRPVSGLTVADSTGPKLAYGAAIAAGTVLAVWLH